MNQEPTTLEPELTTTNQALEKSWSGDSARKILFKVLERVDTGHMIVREQGRQVRQFGRNGDPLSAEVNILDIRCYRRILLGGDAAAGEAFIDGWWDTPDLTSVTRFFARNLAAMDKWSAGFGWAMKPLQWWRLVSRVNTKKQAKNNILAHYDLGNDLYSAFLDSRMQYSSAIFNNPEDSLEQAQINKLQRICEQLQLTEKDHLLEIGSGWGGLAIYAAKNFGCKVTTTTISDRQYDYARTAIHSAGLSEQIQLLNQDYRNLTGKYSKVVSIEMVEAVGKRYLNEYFKKIGQLLQPGGSLLIQAITIADQRYKFYSKREDFIQKHIFPGGFLPSVSVLNQSMARSTDLVVRDILDLGLDYASTLACWRDKLLSNRRQLSMVGYNDRFMRLWLYYLGYCEGGFLERRVSAVQVLASKAPHLV